MSCARRRPRNAGVVRMMMRHQHPARVGEAHDIGYREDILPRRYFGEKVIYPESCRVGHPATEKLGFQKGTAGAALRRRGAEREVASKSAGRSSRNGQGRFSTVRPARVRLMRGVSIRRRWRGSCRRRAATFFFHVGQAAAKADAEAEGRLAPGNEDQRELQALLAGRVSNTTFCGRCWEVGFARKPPFRTERLRRRRQGKQRGLQEYKRRRRRGSAAASGPSVASMSATGRRIHIFGCSDQHSASLAKISPRAARGKGVVAQTVRGIPLRSKRLLRWHRPGPTGRTNTAIW